MSAGARDSSHSLFSSLPSVDELLRSPAGEQWLAEFPRGLVVAEVRRSLDDARRAIAADSWSVDDSPADRVSQRLAALRAPSLRPVINAAGVILHTNLGRAPLSAGAIEAISATAGRYSNLEYDLAEGRRGARDLHAGDLLERLLGAPAIVVNNNAAAIFLILNELAADGETIVSRGELIEIGDGFRIPEILSRCGTRLREVGATNRTRAGDYRQAVNADSRALLRVHPSNFRIVGFAERPSLTELVALAREQELPLIEDLGSGRFYDLAQDGLAEEPLVVESLRAGVDLVCFSGDKLLGGPQAGIIAGRADLVRRVRRNPFFRALRADKMTYAALQATLRDCLLERWDRIPALAMLRTSPEQIRAWAEELAARLGAGAEVRASESLLGGGSTPDQTLATFVVAITPPPGVSAARLDGLLRRCDPAVVARVEDERIVIDLRTVFADQRELLAGAIEAALRTPGADR